MNALRSDSRTKSLTGVADSANAVEADMAKALDFGAVDYWTKPLRVDTVLSEVNTLLAASTPNDRVNERAQPKALLRSHCADRSAAESPAATLARQ